MHVLISIHYFNTFFHTVVQYKLFINTSLPQFIAVIAGCRRAYQRAIAIPTEAIDGLWRTYEGFEYAGPNKTLSRRLLEEQRPKYQQVGLPAVT